MGVSEEQLRRFLETELGSEVVSEEDEDLARIEAERLMELGHVEYEQSHYDAAFGCYESALKVYEFHQDRAGIDKALGSLANIYQARGQRELAIETYERALEISRNWKQAVGRTAFGPPWKRPGSAGAT